MVRSIGDPARVGELFGINGSNEYFHLQPDGHLQLKEDVEFFDTDTATGTKKYSIGLSSDHSSFVVSDEVNASQLLAISPTSGLSIAQPSIATLELCSDSGAASSGDIGTITFAGTNDTLQKVAYASIPVSVVNNTTGSETSRVTLQQGGASSLVLNENRDLVKCDGIEPTSLTAFGEGIQTVVESSSGASMSLNCYDGNPSNSARLVFRKNDGGLNTDIAASSSTRMGFIQFVGNDGSAFINRGVKLSADVTGTVSSGVLPSQFDISCTDTTGSLRQVVVFNEDGNKPLVVKRYAGSSGGLHIQGDATAGDPKITFTDNATSGTVEYDESNGFAADSWRVKSGVVNADGISFLLDNAYHTILPNVSTSSVSGGRPMLVMLSNHTTTSSGKIGLWLVYISYDGTAASASAVSSGGLTLNAQMSGSDLQLQGFDSGTGLSTAGRLVILNGSVLDFFT